MREGQGKEFITRKGQAKKKKLKTFRSSEPLRRNDTLRPPGESGKRESPVHVERSFSIGFDSPMKRMVMTVFRVSVPMIYEPLS